MGLKPDQEALLRLGLPTPLGGQVVQATLDQNELARFRQKASRVRDGAASFSNKERDQMIARLFLNG